MKNLNKTIAIVLGMALPLTVMASPDDDVTIRMMEVNEHAVDAVTSHIDLPAAADDHAREHAANALETANKNRDGEHDSKDNENEHAMEGSDNRDHEMERDDGHEREIDNEQEHEREMDREDGHERDMETERDDRKDVEHEGVDREEIEREGVDEIDHGGNNTQPEIDVPDHDNNQSSHDDPQ